MSLFFSKGGKHIVCGGTTSKIAAKYLGKPLKVSLDSGDDPSIPAKGEIEGVDLVTEGVITMNRVLEYAKDHIGEMHSTVTGATSAEEPPRLQGCFLTKRRI